MNVNNRELRFDKITESFDFSSFPVLENVKTV